MDAELLKSSTVFFDANSETIFYEEYPTTYAQLIRK